MRFRYCQGKISQYFKLKSTKKQAKLKRKFITCETRPDRNVRTGQVERDNGYSDTVRNVGPTAVLARKDRRQKRHQHQRANATKTKLRTLINRHMMQCELQDAFNHIYKNSLKPIREYDLVNKKWSVIRPETGMIYSGDEHHHVVTRLSTGYQSSYKTPFESLNRKRRRNVLHKNQRRREKMAEEELKKQIAVAKSVIDRTC